jgi:hypothetical protein
VDIHDGNTYDPGTYAREAVEACVYDGDPEEVAWLAWIATVLERGPRVGAADFHQDVSQRPLFYCIFGNPFRPIDLNRAWLTSTVVSLASAVYEDRAYERLPILADALEEAGCRDAAILEHCRGLGPHVRGCWVIDLLLGKT